jgi:alanine dehydrogenase
MPGAVPETSTHALVNATLPYTLEIARDGLEGTRRGATSALAEGVNVVDGTSPTDLWAMRTVWRSPRCRR